MQVSDSALREGLLHELLGRAHQQDVRSQAVMSLARRYHVDEVHAQHVAKTAITCARQVSKAWKLNLSETHQWLEWAAQLHEIGLDIAHSQYHKHGAYIAEHTDLAGFSRQEQLVLAVLIYNHRRKLSKDMFQRLAEYRVDSARYWAIILRLAVLLHRGRDVVPLPNIALAASKKSLDIRFPKGWLEERQLTKADLQQEANYLAAVDFKLSFA
jgi:exopolyphosphatase/guanosine-5'-triphosphate,3'-diphosphate pyrophosphatase